MIRTSTHDKIVRQMQSHIDALKEKMELRPQALREFTILFKNKRTVKVIGATIDFQNNSGFAVRTVVNGVEKTVHWFSEQPVEWFCRWL